MDKMSLHDFLNIAKNIKTKGKEIDSDLLISFYHDIKEQPIALHSSEKKKLEI
jgi:Sec7-like guanine-nucleotide exchange factor